MNATASSSATQMAGFQRDGFVVHPNIFSAEEVQSLKDHLSRLAREADDQGHHPLPALGLQFEHGVPATSVPRADRERLVRKYFNIAPADPAFRQHCCDPRLIALLEPVIGQDLVLLQSQALVKPAQLGSAKDWHQDCAYFPVTPGDAAVGLWIALDDADQANGCMQVVPGSHRSGEQRHVEGPTGHMLPAAVVSAEADRIRALPMRAGSVLVFSARLWHYTARNASQAGRRAIQYHYAPTSATVASHWPVWPLPRLEPA